MNFTTLNGKLVTLWMAWQIGRLDAAFFVVFGLHLIVADAIRTYAEQERVFRERYVTSGNVRGRRVYDTRMWNGTRWYRISSIGTVAVPGSSNHEIQGDYAAVDFWDTGNDPGVSRAGTARANWLRANAHRFDFEPEGYGFNEAWHYRARNIRKTPPVPAPAPADAGAAPIPILEDTDMMTIKWNDHIYTVGPSYLKHETNGGQAGIMAWLLNRNDRMIGDGVAFVGVSNNDLNAIQKSLSIPWYAFELTMSGRGFNIEGNRGNGQGDEGRVWSLQHEINQKLDGIRLDTTGLAKTFDELRKKLNA